MRQTRSLQKAIKNKSVWKNKHETVADKIRYGRSCRSFFFRCSAERDKLQIVLGLLFFSVPRKSVVHERAAIKSNEIGNIVDAKWSLSNVAL